jgi:hypothetical protein
MATAVSTQLSALTGANTIEQMMGDVNSLKTLSALATDAAGSGDFVPTTGGNFTGNVGIGTSNPINGGRYLDITNSNGVATDFSIVRLITQEVGSSSTTSADLFKRKNGQLTLSNNDTDSAAHLTLQVGATERMRITSGGNIGIGTTSPAEKLHIAGGSTTGSLIVSESTSTSQYSGGGIALMNGATSNDSHVLINTFVRDSDGSDSGFTINQIDGNRAFVNTLAGYDLGNHFWNFNTSGTERMRIASTGDITFKQGVVNLESASGNPAQMNFYCETGNAHYTRIQSSPHASYSGNVVLTLPTTSGTLATTATAATTGKAIAMAIVFG